MTADAYVCPPAPVDPLVEITRQRDGLLTALRECLIFVERYEHDYASPSARLVRMRAQSELSRAEARP